ncbi:MAG: NupC/NupG family nucleoside CNT transporter [Acidobacteria bacterium]|nr:NupC/NupG family nucleoside CNT transporter [Acidobacteriota bacterium]
MERFTGLLGLAAILALAYLLSSNRRAVDFRVVTVGLALQLGFAFLVLNTPVGVILQGASAAVNSIIHYAEEGSKFLFGPLGAASKEFGVIFAFQVLPIIIFVASLFSCLYYLGIMQIFVKAMAVAMYKLMRISGAEATCVSASIFMGQTEAPLTIRPFVSRLTQSELFTIMSSGMAHVSGAVMAAYVMIANVEIQHLLTAVIMTAPATILLAKMLIPETEKPKTQGEVKVEVEKPGVNLIDAAARGAGDGLQLALNVGAMLIASVGLIALVNGIFGWIHGSVPAFPESLQTLLGWVLAPAAWLLGVSWKDSQAIGNLMGTRLVLNEFIAFAQLGPMKESLDPKSFVIATYALCGFANLGSIAIQVGGIGALAPERRSDLARFGMRALLAGTLANFMSAAIVGVLLGIRQMLGY